MTKTVGISNILNQPHAVQHFLPQILKVRENVYLCDTQTADPALIFRINRFPRKLRTGIDGFRTVHGSGAPGKQQAVPGLQFFFQTQFLHKGVLSRDMTAGQNQHIHFRQPVNGLPVSSVAHEYFGDAETAHGESSTQAG